MIVKLIVQTLIWYGGIGILLFLSAGTFKWPGAWAFLVELTMLGLIAGLVLARRDPALLNERLGPPIQKDQAPADKVFMGALLVLFPLWLVFMAFDAVRYRWSSVPGGVQVLGALGIALSIWISYLTLRENSFAAPVVKIQKDRGQRVISTGPYSYVRHPMYFGAMFFFLGTPLLLGSYWGVAFAGVIFSASVHPHIC